MKNYVSIFVLFISCSFLNAQTTTWNGSSWDNGVPDNTFDAVITGVYNTAAHGVFTSKNLDVSATGSLTISPNTTLTVQTNLTNSGTFTIEDKSSLVMIDDSGTVTGTYVVNKDTPNYPITDIFSFYSTPVIEADSNLASIFNPSDDVVYYWDTSVSPTQWVFIPWNIPNSMGVGKGYAVRPDNTTGVITRTYTGQLNTGDISVPVYYSDSSTSPGQFGYNIIGNPYASAIDWFAFKEDNASLLSGTMYYWRQLETGATNYASDYVALNYLGVVPYNAANEFIGSTQGFVAKTNATSSVIFKNSHRVNGSNEQFFSSNGSGPQSRLLTQGNSWLNLESATELSTILIGFNSNATTAFDDDYDGVFIGTTDPLQLYSLQGTDKLLINGQPELIPPINVTVPLGIVTPATGNYTISIEEEFIGSEYFIKLEDTQTMTITDLRLSDYTFTGPAPPGEDNTRFLLHYEYDISLGIEEENIDDTSVKFFFNGDELNTLITGNFKPDSMKLYDLNGRTLYDGTFKNKMLIQNLASGVYYVNLHSEEFRVVSKTVVKQ